MPLFHLQKNLFIGGNRYRKRDNPVFIPDCHVSSLPESAKRADGSLTAPTKESAPVLLRDLDPEREAVKATQKVERFVQDADADAIEQARRKFKK